MRAVAAGITDVGRQRDHNEDRFVLLPEFGVFVVADGMGGHQCGEVASRMATSTVAAYFRRRRALGTDNHVPDVLRAAIAEANEKIHRRGNHSYGHRGMGTTVVAAGFARETGRVCVVHAGDSRCYRLRNRSLDRVTQDHSLVEEALRTRPDLTEDELAYLPGNVITRALGVEATVDLELYDAPAQLGDTYLLCSDGLTGFITDEVIRDVLNRTSVLTTACSQLVEAANEGGGGDNITVVLVRFESAEDPWSLPTTIPPGPKSTIPPARRSSPPSSAAPAPDEP